MSSVRSDIPGDVFIDAFRDLMARKKGKRPIMVPALRDLHRLSFPGEDQFHPFHFCRLILRVIARITPDRRRRSLECAGHASAFPFSGTLQRKHSTLNFYPSTFNIRGGQVGVERCATPCPHDALNARLSPMSNHELQQLTFQYGTTKYA